MAVKVASEQLGPADDDSDSGDVPKETTDELMQDVLADFRANPQALAVDDDLTAHYWPCFPLRKILGLAEVGLHDAVLDGDVEGVRAAVHRLSKRAPRRLNEYDPQGRTALSLAVKTGREDVADQLIGMPHVELGVPDVATGLTALHHAVLLNMPRTVDRLIKAEAPIDTADKLGMTALMLACRKGRKLMVELLVEDADAQLELADAAGWTAVFYATYHDEGELVEYLVQHGCDLGHRDKKGMSPLDWADSMNHDDLVVFLNECARAGLGGRAL